MNIYFMIDELNRDAVVASALKKKFAEKGHHLVYGNRASNRLLKYFHGAFDVIVFPRPHLIYDNWGEDWLTWKARFVTLSTESLGIISKDHQVMAKTLLDREYFEGKRKYVERIDALCFWGDKQLQAVKDYAPEVAHKCHVVGHPRHDGLCVKRPKEERGALRGTKKSVGVITRAVALNDYFKRSPMDWYATIFDDHVNYEFHNKITGEKLLSKRATVSPANMLVVQAIDVENTLKIINNLLQAGHQVSLRIHPKDDSNIWRDVLRRCKLNAEISDPALPITDWLQGHDYIFGPPSTSFYDGVMLGVTPISICNLDSRRRESIGELWEENNCLMDHVFKPESIDDLLQYIDAGVRNVDSPEILNILADEANFPACAHALDQVVDVCLANPAGTRRTGLSLLAFKLARAGYFVAWRLRSFFLGRKENSAMFAMTARKIRFINSLSSANSMVSRTSMPQP
jgi:surface carbohydrate biosynthesis protein